MRLAYLGSGSRGNAALVEYRDTLLMIDCGFSISETERRLARAGRDPADITAILVTHEHSDHASGVLRLAARHAIPVYLTPGTGLAIGAGAHTGGVRNEIHCIDAHGSFELGQLQVHPLPVPHDAREPCQFMFEAQGRRLGVLTDTGHLTPHLLARLGDCDALVVECNHDIEMLADGHYPAALKRRVGGHLGHLNNAQAAALAAVQDTARLQWLVGVHLSAQNNTPERARSALTDALGGACVPIWLADQDEGLDWLELSL
jgi:phosphoribosyl 1,2-cyclic phosphodiesterase